MKSITSATWVMMAPLIVAATPATMSGQGLRMSTPSLAGSDQEQLARIRDLLDSTSRRQWTIRPLVDSAVAGMSLIAPSLMLVENSSFPYGFNDGPVWAGKGMTAAVSGGIAVERPHLSVMIAPTAFMAQNASFAIADNGQSGDRRFANPVRPDAIDQPQRFGEKTYAALAPGESEIALDAFGLAAGISSRTQVWGPAYEHPLILGNNAGGIPRVFAGTKSPVDLRWIRIHGQVLWGQVVETAYGPDTGTSRRHFVTGAIGTVTIPRVPGLELGVTRFFHADWPAAGAAHVPWLRVLQGFISSNPAIGENPDNQLASAFLRIAPPGSGFEVYGEFGREDRPENFRDLLLEPDHDAGYLVGFARAWSTPDKQRMHVVRGEVMNTRLSPLQQQRPQTPWYMHTTQAQGHTLRGQVLGSAGGFGGGASNFAVDRYASGSRTTIRWDRVVMGALRGTNDLPVPDRSDVTQAVGLERASPVGRGELTMGTAVVKEFNRYFGADAMNLNVSVSYRVVR